MKIRVRFGYFLAVLALPGGSLSAQTTAGPAAKNGSHTAMNRSAMDRDLMEVTIPRLEEFYRSHKYTVTEVLQWYMARIAKYNGIYRAVQTLDVGHEFIPRTCRPAGRRYRDSRIRHRKKHPNHSRVAPAGPRSGGRSDD